MKIKFIFFFLLINSFFYSQTIDHILFEYDSAGNQIKRYTIDINAGRPANGITKEIEDITKDDLILSDVYDDISYYPNPVKEILYVKWINKNNEFVNSVHLYSVSGQSVKIYTNLKGTDALSVPFDNLPQGLYTLALKYSTGEEKTLKIIKN
ncbi:T9SS type A sorting domain-containing protein [Flavobacterium piscinae]|uniref:T9SS type A sorting domain-containing protein n=1 Tax=Flavobacterium piscinae TaxID=2506424 RepID=A0A4Q1KYM9_9FLAO|nr:T9SS type A sorting domain-containing protein [Flavobacterium piscinae]MBC8883871.1 T9SS type A sorting domain-containing protein [Flavobacterium piscinae]RXR35422.1 T9SS type A sorting domain-containing protein [Flavobacterium piscinae]